MKTKETQGGAGLLLLALLVVAVMMSREHVEDRQPARPSVPTAMFDDVRVKLPAELHDIIAGFIETGRIKIGKAGIDTTKVETIHVRPGVLEFVPPLRVTYDTALMTAGSTVREIRLGSDGEIEVDVVNSPIDVRFER